MIRKSYLRRRAEGGPGSRVAEDGKAPGHRSLLGAISDLFNFGRGDRPPAELDDLSLPDLLSRDSEINPEIEELVNLLELAFLGRASAGEIDRDLDAMEAGNTDWMADHFFDDLFLGEVIKRVLTVEVEGQSFRLHRVFLERVLATPPTGIESVHFRQEILRELEEDVLFDATEKLLTRIYHLLTLLRASRDDARLEPARFRFDVLEAYRRVVIQMDEGFQSATSGLMRLHECGSSIRASAAFQNLVALLDHYKSMATLRLEAVVGADGRLRHLEIRGLEERRKNPFFRRPLRRWIDRIRVLYHRYSLQPGEMVERLLMGVFQENITALARVVQAVCHLEFYMAARTFAAQARSRGLEVCLPEIESGVCLRIDRLFNPLLLSHPESPTPTDIIMESTSPITLVTGPNSGGKTRLLQAVGIAQLLAQSGFYAPCARGCFPFLNGLFASITELDRADQIEGRLGTELVRLRALFETVPQNSLVLLDELCSGTNPSEAIEIVEMVLRLLRQLEPVAFVTTHFLDFAQKLHGTASSGELGFLQAEVTAAGAASFRFIEGVASTSLAASTARRLGVTFDELERTLDQRGEKTTRGDSEQIGDLPQSDHSE